MKIFAPFIKRKCKRIYDEKVEKSKLTYQEWKESNQYIPRDKIENKYHYPAIIYGDYEVKMSGKKEEVLPIFLPDFSPNRWDNEDYLGTAVFIREDIYNSIKDEAITRRELIQNVVNSGERICHVPQMLASIDLNKIYKNIKYDELENYIWIGDLEKENGKQILQITGEIPLVSVIIPSKDNAEMLENAIESIILTTNEKRGINYKLEFIIVDNGSNRENQLNINKLCNQIEERALGEISCVCLYEEREFNFSYMCNLGADYAKGKYLLFANDDIEAVTQDWLTQMLIEATKDYTGAVGAKLLYPDGYKIQHAGITNLKMGPVHKLQFMDDREIYYDDRNRGIHNVSAVTGALVLVSKSKFNAVGKMDEELAVAFNDVDLCFGLLKKGYYNVVCCDFHFIHKESATRGQDTTITKRQRLLEERDKLYAKYPELIGIDAYYAKGLNNNYLDTEIKPKYLDGKTYTQIVKNKDIRDTDFKQKEKHIALNHCLDFTIEQVYEDKGGLHLSGYSFVVGSDNCLFEKKLLFKNKEGYVQEVTLENMYRPSIASSLKDQINVELLKFDVAIEKNTLKKGEYLIGILAKDKSSSLTLLQWSNVCRKVGF